MGVTWTKEQQQVIDQRDCNILVSAAAGSGKTAVLVERIKERILDEKCPVNIDEILVVTFTKAAAAQMRDRVGTAIEAELEHQPDNTRLATQLALVHNAQITTIDSFCLYVIRNHFHCIDLEPNFRIADEGELKLLKEDVLAAVIEEKYKAGDEEFLRFTDSYAAGRTDAGLGDLILQLFEYSRSYPWPSEWLAGCVTAYQVHSDKELEHAPFMQAFLEYVRAVLQGILDQIDTAIHICELDDGPYMYEKTLLSDKELIEQLMQATTFEELHQHLYTPPAFVRLASSKGFAGDSDKQELVKAVRDDVKKTIKKLSERFFYAGAKEHVAQMERVLVSAGQLVDITIAFADAFATKKREKNIVDFSDLEHFALDILVDQETKQATATAVEFQNAYVEIMIDEYQDSNYVQESILRAISREARGENNIFMVGDVKQSIYRFRLARPELFMEKFDSYSTNPEGAQVRIDLHKNFRSRKEVLAVTNLIFDYVMHRDLGNVEYDADARLNEGASYPQSEQFLPEVLLADSREELGEEETGSAQTAGMDRQTKEAEIVADRIERMMAEQCVTDEESKKPRPVRYFDIVILLRSLSGWADTFAEVLGERGIPVATVSKTGYFSTIEIQTILSYLRLLDNPKQDIPMAAVLKSPMAGLDDEDLAQLRVCRRDGGFADAVMALVQHVSGQGEEKDGREDGKLELPEELLIRLTRFLQTYQRLRGKVADTPIHELLTCILEETGYGNYVACMPAGKQRMANVNMLIEKAIAYEGTSYRGLFHFIRYIDELQKYDVDFGEADLVSENEDAVRIMSIHKSKGLEFPVVFVCGLGKQFNRQDTRSKMILHPALGLGLDEIDSVRHVKIPTMLKRVIGQETDLENLGEELRILYVALTRAQEKLVLTGTVKDVDAWWKKLVLSHRGVKRISYLDRIQAKCYLDWIGLALAAGNEDGQVAEVRMVSLADLVADEVKHQAEQQVRVNEKLALTEQVPQKLYEQVEQRLSYEYPYENTIHMVTKYSVSELKHRAMREKMQAEEQDVTPKFMEVEPELYVPAFISGEETISEVNPGALRGTAVHRVLECMDFGKLPNPSDATRDAAAEHELLRQAVTAQVDEMLALGRITPQMHELVKVDALVGFLSSDVGRRICAADRADNLFREKPFVMGMPDNEVEETSEITEMVLIQGIIDVFWIENDEIVVLDYKTDRVDTAQQLTDMYAKQLELYADALQRAWELPVKQKYLYSFRLQETIELE